MAEFLTMLSAVEIDADNDTIMLDELGVVAVATLTHGTFFVRGDGTADDLLANIATALGAAFVGGNTYGVTLTTNGTIPSLNVTASSPSGIVRVAGILGGNVYRVRWLHASTTFDPAILGFAAEKAAANLNSETSTLSPSAIWVPSDRHIDLIPELATVRAENELASGGLDVVDRSDVAHSRRVLFQLIDGRRVWAHRITSDPDRSWGRFWSRVKDGRALELHELDLQSGSSSLLGAMSSSTRHTSDDVTQWVLAGESGDRVVASRVRTGMDHWDFEVLVRGYVDS